MQLLQEYSSSELLLGAIASSSMALQAIVLKFNGSNGRHSISYLLTNKMYKASSDCGGLRISKMHRLLLALANLTVHHWLWLFLLFFYFLLLTSVLYPFPPFQLNTSLLSDDVMSPAGHIGQHSASQSETSDWLGSAFILFASMRRSLWHNL